MKRTYGIADAKANEGDEDERDMSDMSNWTDEEMDAYEEARQEAEDNDNFATRYELNIETIMAEKAERDAEEAEKAAAKAAVKAAKARRFDRNVAIDPTPVPVPADTMPGMSKANAALYVLAASGIMPIAPDFTLDFTRGSYRRDLDRLNKLIAMVEAGDVAGLRAYAIKVYYTGAQELDRFRHRAILALEAQDRGIRL